MKHAFHADQNVRFAIQLRINIPITVYSVIPLIQILPNVIKIVVKTNLDNNYFIY